MSLKFKALGLGLIATMVMSAFAAMNATAGTGGHFHASKNGQDVKHPTIKVTEEGTHAVHLKIHGAEGEVGCTEANYTTTLLNATENDITVSPEYKGCTTTNTPTNVTIDMNGCGYTFKVAAGTTGAT
ncbi:MAG TPA: hypothetical protein VF729_06820, partial [Solirubrobacterales bacterium]